MKNLRTAATMAMIMSVALGSDFTPRNYYDNRKPKEDKVPRPYTEDELNTLQLLSDDKTSKGRKALKLFRKEMSKKYNSSQIDKVSQK